MYNTILPSLLLLLMPLGASAQFYTISKASDSVQVLSSKRWKPLQMRMFAKRIQLIMLEWTPYPLLLQ